MDVTCTHRTVGGTNRGRQIAGALALVAGAVACGATAVAGWPLYQTLFLLGGVATLAWLVDGSSRRFMGPGLLALATGGGITLYQALDMEAVKGEHTLVYPLIGAALLITTLFNPLDVRGAGAFLVIVGAVAFVDTPWAPGWTLAGILALWGVVNLVRTGRAGGSAVSPNPEGRVGSDGRVLVDARR